ncbi:ubiquitin carboxyl-terminal hydrolase 20-like isoform X1 [Lingula anatina]|uniref:Ubiquitin carboxyl-terminal hydrolase n=2 Tax=Lingula anatina TaxID=7574 RepID=A0A1S3JSN8_LINAN|nr:ubiquitin carboxyl-terminal hydrolase 20-like isoform X1 [Lingula anatina]|eukprot:XP_013413385.1 ubiquitin carboxyl-terminal hydrolase 20-like isoform X1 [Lingula anatina]
MSQRVKVSHCPHVNSVGDNSWEDVRRKKERADICDSCNAGGPNLWLCLHSRCMFVGCGESGVDHSSSHAEVDKHCLAINLKTMRIWCYRCECEVYKDGNKPAFVMRERSILSPHGTFTPDPVSQPPTPHHYSRTTDSEDSEDDEVVKPRGLVGLQNLGNTCYLNAAIQALSNCQPLTRYFLDCSSYVRSDRKPMLSRSYLKLVQEIWHKKRPSYVVPSGIVQGIKVIHPMFRGYSQQDTQEFLRCFMDQLHEELKQPVMVDEEDEDEEEQDEKGKPSPANQEPPAPLEVEAPDSTSQSEEDYETCDSGMSSEQSSMEANFSSNNSTGMGTESIHCDIPDNDQMEHLEDQQQSTADRRVTRSMTRNRQQSEKTEENAEFKDALNDADVEVETGHRSVVSGHSSPKTGHRSQGDRPISQSAKKKAVQFKSVITDIFDGKILSSVQCLTCESVSTTKETFQDLSLPIPSREYLSVIHSQGAQSKMAGACGDTAARQGWITWMFGWMRNIFWGPMVTLTDCLAAFFSADELKGDNMYSCEKCKKLRNGIKNTKVLQLPEILCIHLKRFRHEFMFSAKISSYVSFPIEGLDMRPYLHKDCKSAMRLYDLTAVICHHGTAGGGHYTAYALNHYDDKWYEYDDQYVTEVDVQTVQNCEAYVLFYRKKNDDIMVQRQKAMELVESKEPSLLNFYVSKQWINRFNTFAEPGPITNEDFLCKHGAVPPTKFQNVLEMVAELPQTLWDCLHERYGGGPVCNHLYLCVTCQAEQVKLRRRQSYELDTFVKLHEDFKEEDNPCVIYAISMQWFKQWENFVKGMESEPPGQIDNSKICFKRNDQYIVKQSSSYGQLSEEMWHFLHGIYNGGPLVVCCQSTPQVPSHSAPPTPAPRPPSPTVTMQTTHQRPLTPAAAPSTPPLAQISEEAGAAGEGSESDTEQVVQEQSAHEDDMEQERSPEGASAPMSEKECEESKEEKMEEN